MEHYLYSKSSAGGSKPAQFLPLIFDQWALTKEKADKLSGNFLLPNQELENISVAIMPTHSISHLEGNACPHTKGY